MDEFTKMLQEEMSYLDDIESQKGQELRKELGIEQLQGKELLKYKIDFIAKNMRYGNLHCFEKNDYFKELLTSCIDKESAQYLTPTTITCITNDSKPRIFWVFTDNDDKTKIIYSISDDEDISEISQEDVKQQFANGMRTLSKSRENELKEILLGTDEETTIFKEKDIGKTTINTSTEIKDELPDLKGIMELQDFVIQELNQRLNEQSRISEQIIEEKVRFFHDQKSDEFFEDMQTGRYSITEPQIGKATINTSTEIKDEAEEKVIRDEQQREQEEFQKMSKLL